jgi:HlyD family secretion protein
VKTKWKILIGAGVVVTAAVGGYASYRYKQRGIVTVQTGRVVREDLVSTVTATGEIKPRNYVNIGANAMGRITEILIKEGDRVRKGQLLARLESVQPEADLSAQRAAVSSAQAESAAAEAAVKSADDNLLTLQAGVDRAKADLERFKLELERGQSLFDAKLIAKQEYDQRSTAFRAQEAMVREAQARLVAAKAQRQETAARLAAAQRRIAQSQAVLARVNDVLEKHYVIAPLDGMVTNLPVRVGETVVIGIQNSPGSLVMTIADMSLITAEVKVDETDIVNVKLDQPVDITIDAMPNRTFKGRVIEIGNTAILRSTGLAASQSMISSQEAKDFKVVVAMDDPPAEIRPGLSCAVKVTTATRKDVLTVPIQAVTVREKGDLEPVKEGEKPKEYSPAEMKARKEELQGLFVVKGDKVEFRKVETGITGTTEIEVLNGVNEKEQIVTGSYKVIRTIRNETRIKIDNKQQQKKAES